MVDIRLYPSFHQLSEEELSSKTLQSDPDVHAYAHKHTLVLIGADILQCWQSLITAEPHRCFPLITTVIMHACGSDTSCQYYHH